AVGLDFAAATDLAGAAHERGGSRGSQPESRHARGAGGPSGFVLELVPARYRCKLQQCARASWVAVRELRVLIVPDHLEQALLDPVVEPGASEDQLAQPVDERLAADQRDPLPVADEIPPELAARLLDAAVGGELDEVGGLVIVQLVGLDQAELDRSSGNALLEVRAVEAEPVSQELDDVVVARAVVGVADGPRAALHRGRIPTT